MDDLSPTAIVTLERCAMLMSVTDDIEELIPHINYASAAIQEACQRSLVRSSNIRVIDSFGDGVIVLGAKPLVNVDSVRYDVLRVFGDDTEITGFTFGAESGKIFLPEVLEMGESVLRIVTTEGYDRIAYTQALEPAQPKELDVWVRPDGTVVKFLAGKWTTLYGFPMPYDLEGATVEYVAYLRTRFRTGGAGLVKRERGYSFEGSAIEYERTMPTHVRDKILPYMRHAV